MLVPLSYKPYKAYPSTGPNPNPGPNSDPVPDPDPDPDHIKL